MPELARQPADGVIDRSKTRDTPCFPLAAKGRLGVWNSHRGNHLGQRSCASAKTGRTYGRKRFDQSTAQINLARRRPSTYGKRSSRLPSITGSDPKQKSDLQTLARKTTLRCSGTGMLNCKILDLRFQALPDEITACHSSLGGEFGDWIDVVKDAQHRLRRRERSSRP